MARRDQEARCIAYQCADRPYARQLCPLHYDRWRRGERVNLATGKALERDPAERALANAEEIARRRELHAARLAGCPLERAIESGQWLSRGKAHEACIPPTNARARRRA